FAHAKAMEAQLRRWPAERAAAALSALYRAEMDVKRTGAPDRLIAGRAALRLARMAAAKR
ncbi:MAG: DNA polymerase III subunit delta, partial [Pseudomonadota bacterium]